MKANIYYNSKSNPDYCGEGVYVLVLVEKDECVGGHLCSDRDWAIHDFITMHQDAIKKNKITEIYSLGKLVWSSK